MMYLRPQGKKSIDWAETVADEQRSGTLEKNFQKHIDEAWQLVRALQATQLTVKPEKFHFFRCTIEYVGHILKDGKRLTDPGNLQAIEE